MPLRKQEKIPKVPKTRKKTIDKLKDTTPAKKEDQIEYRVKAFFHYDDVQQKQFYIISVETVKEFTFLSYEVTVDVLFEKETIDISLRGLNTLQSYLVTAKPAYTEIQFEDLIGKYTVNMIKQDGTMNSAVYDFNIYKKEITLVKTFLPEKKNNRHFCEFSVDEEKFSFD